MKSTSLLKKILNELYPTVTWSVRKAQGVDSIRVNTEDGPPPGDIRELLNMFSSGSYNGQQDYFEYGNTSYAYGGEQLEQFQYVSCHNIGNASQEHKYAAQLIAHKRSGSDGSDYRDYPWSNIYGEFYCTALKEVLRKAHPRQDSKTLKLVEAIPRDCNVNDFLLNQVARQKSEKEREILQAYCRVGEQARKSGRL